MAEVEKQAGETFAVDALPGQVRLRIAGATCDMETVMPNQSAIWLASELLCAARSGPVPAALDATTDTSEEPNDA